MSNQESPDDLGLETARQFGAELAQSGLNCTQVKEGLLEKGFPSQTASLVAEEIFARQSEACNRRERARIGKHWMKWGIVSFLVGSLCLLVVFGLGWPNYGMVSSWIMRVGCVAVVAGVPGFIRGLYLYKGWSR
jgi:hypothetical protein